MLRARFEKTGKAVYISHLDLMRLFQRAFKRAGLPLTHTQGYNPRPSVSIALPLSLGVESHCELLDFELEGETVENDEIVRRLNEALVEGVRVHCVYTCDTPIRNIALLDCSVKMTYDRNVPTNAVERLRALFTTDTLTVEKRNKNGTQEQNIIPMIQTLEVAQMDAGVIRLDARVCCQNPALNPMQLVNAIHRYLPECAPDFAQYSRIEIYNADGSVFR